MAEKTRAELLVSVGALQERLAAERDRPTVGKVASALDDCIKALDRIKAAPLSYSTSVNETRDVEQVIRFLAVRYGMHLVENHYIPCKRIHTEDDGF